MHAQRAKAAAVCGLLPVDFVGGSGGEKSSERKLLLFDFTHDAKPFPRFGGRRWKNNLRMEVWAMDFVRTMAARARWFIYRRRRLKLLKREGKYLYRGARR